MVDKVHNSQAQARKPQNKEEEDELRQKAREVQIFHKIYFFSCVDKNLKCQYWACLCDFPQCFLFIGLSGSPSFFLIFHRETDSLSNMAIILHEY